MKKLVINGDPGVRKGGVIEYDGEEWICFGVARQGEYHGPDRPQLRVTMGKEEDRETYERREYIPMHLDTESASGEEIEVIRKSRA
jgi:hypothetical protein